MQIEGLIPFNNMHENNSLYLVDLNPKISYD